ncbi:redoxin domain-containing protein [Paenibacillus arenilitoris]|uniref:Redoxin domain-containing protein n=1 Tax=Paenibacillus arenilitoris TaxID=2772299 RepID=A0A927H7H9_9BACL|nr:redoxin domain-containing protein [Paenibacillus arenilitoris]MBD2869614.1 redoxin domain-containing protein [Paenibacillus arenilitoris]
MGKSRKTVQIVILLAVLLIGGYAIGTALFADNDKGPLGAGSEPPPFKLADLDGNLRELSDYEGKPVVVNFWGTFCPPCVKEMPEFERQYEKWKDQGLVILAINLSEDTLTVNNFVRRFELQYPILRDVNRKTERSYGLKSYPTTFFIGRDGKIAEIKVGGMTEAEIDERVERLLKT